MRRSLAGLAVASLIAVSSLPTLAAPATPVGAWQVSTGEARYEITSCGAGGELCARLVWLHPDERTPENLALMNKLIVRGAERDGANVWTGAVVFEGRSYEGTMTLVSVDKMTLKGCSGLLCKTYELVRV